LLTSSDSMNPDKQTLDELRIDRTGPSSRGQAPVKAIVVVLLLVLAAGGVIWWLNRPKPAVVRTITVQAPTSGRDKILLNGTGYVTARNKATVSSKVTGKVIEVFVEEGMKVEAGQVLARLDASNVEKSLHLAEAQANSARKALDETQANLEQAEREFRRVSQLVASGIASASELDKAEALAKSLRARLQRQEADVAVAEREVALWKQQMEDTVIRAPFSGIVTTKDSQPGEMISPISAGSGFTRTGICTIVDMSSLEIEVEVNESYINRVKPAQPVEATLDSYPDWQIPAKVIAIIPTADRQKATVKVRVRFEKLDPRILPDMSVKVGFQDASVASAPTNEEKASARADMTIPKSAVRQRDGRDIVWVVRDGRAEPRAVTVATTRGEEVAIAAGLSGGERVVIDRTDTLAEGTRVTEQK
jgi:RND family efflux transporter MFP subunit